MNPITTEQIDSILPFLDKFEVEGFYAGDWKTKPGQMPWFHSEDIVMEFVQALYDNGWITPEFDWMEWEESAHQYVESPEKVAAADAATIQKLLTTHVRADRFGPGHLGSMFENGHILALLQRLRVLRSELAGEADA